MKYRNTFMLIGLFLSLSVAGAADKPDARVEDWMLRNGRLMVDGKWVFLKIGKPLSFWGQRVASLKRTPKKNPDREREAPLPHKWGHPGASHGHE